jgi:SAM-dependent methyltransferase
LFKSSSSDQTRAFYDGLAQGTKRRGLWGMENRFDPDTIAGRPSVRRHFLPAVQRHLSTDDVCLDLGCGPGGFLQLMAPLTGRIVGADIVPQFVTEAQATIDRHALGNAEAVLVADGPLPFDDAAFDKVVLIDTIHHLEDVDGTLAEVARVLRPDGHLLVFEPNKLNPPLAAMCVLDKNEHGLLRLGTKRSYRRLLDADFDVEHTSYNGVLIGPEGGISEKVADYVSTPGNRALGWLSPKLFIVARRR